MKITYTGLRDERFNYIVELNGHEFTYFQGIGHCYISKGSKGKKSPLDIITDKEDEIFVKNKMFKRVHLEFMERIYISFPKEESILECLEFDSQCGNLSFYDFCDEFGYDHDSIKALNIHFACMETAKKLRGFKFPIREDE